MTPQCNPMRFAESNPMTPFSPSDGPMTELLVEKTQNLLCRFITIPEVLNPAFHGVSSVVNGGHGAALTYCYDGSMSIRPIRHGTHAALSTLYLKNNS